MKGTKVIADGSRNACYFYDASLYIRFILFEMGLHFKASCANIINHFAKVMGLFSVNKAALIYNLFVQIFRIFFIPITTFVQTTKCLGLL